MRCPPEIAEIVCQILRQGLLRIRVCAWNNDPARCAIEADHLHNLPSLLNSFDPKLLDYYWHAERESFIEQGGPGDTGFEPLWELLAKHLTPPTNQALAG